MPVPPDAWHDPEPPQSTPEGYPIHQAWTGGPEEGYAPPAAPPRQWHPVPWVMGGVILVAVLLIIGFSVSGSGGPKGYNDPNQLAQSVQDQLGAKNDTTVTAVCVHQSAQQFLCNMSDWGNGDADSTALVTVEKDGSSWVSTSYSGGN